MNRYTDDGDVRLGLKWLNADRAWYDLWGALVHIGRELELPRKKPPHGTSCRCKP